MLINIDFRWLKQGIKNRNSVLNRVGKSAIFVLNRVRVWGAAPHLPTQGYIEYPPRVILNATCTPPTQTFFLVRYAFLPHVGQERVTKPWEATIVLTITRTRFNWLHLTWMPLSQSNYTLTKSYAGLATIAYVAAGTYMITRYIADLDFYLRHILTHRVNA